MLPCFKAFLNEPFSSGEATIPLLGLQNLAYLFNFRRSHFITYSIMLGCFQSPKHAIVLKQCTLSHRVLSIHPFPCPLFKLLVILYDSA